MNIYSVDASIIIKWVLEKEKEADFDKAMGLLNEWVMGTIEIVAPSLWQYEVGNFLGRELPQEAAKAMRFINDLGFASIDLNDKMQGLCFKWMAEAGVTFYDAAYLAVAVETGGIMVTADEKFARKLKDDKHICLLKNLDLNSQQ